jgi:SNF2 family DNA or RNA helicase
LADTKEKQSKCIFAVITILRMFVSHPLLAEKTLGAVLDQRVIAELKAVAQAEGVAEKPSGIIIDLILGVGDKVASRPRLPGDFPKLLELFQNHLMHIHQQYGNYEKFLRMNCPRCESLPTEEAFVVTSCLHVYCEGCFDELPNQDGKTDTIARVCTSCEASIQEAGYSGDSPKDSPKKGSPKKSSPKKRKQSNPKGKGKDAFKKRPQKSFKKQVLLRDPSDDEWDEPSEDEGDWISRIGDRMPSAKITAVRGLISEWVKEDEEVKIVVFVQFLKTVQLLQLMCEKEGWKYAVVC